MHRGEKMKRLPSNQQQREDAFGRSCVALRKTMDLTQRALGRLLGVSEQAIQHWERGVHAPSPEHLERLLALFFQRHASAPGREYAEAQQMWWAAGQQEDFDASWIRVQLAAPSARSALVVLKREAAQSAEPGAQQEPLSTSSHFDWGDAL